jgi:hypothetical protein
VPVISVSAAALIKNWRYMLVLLKLSGKKPAQIQVTPPLWHCSLFMAASNRGIAYIKFCFKMYIWRICNARVINLNIPQDTHETAAMHRKMCNALGTKYGRCKTSNAWLR